VPLPNIISGIDSENQIRIETEIRGLYKNINYGAILDTGFSGGLLLPLITAVDVGLEKVGGGNVVLADGSSKNVPIFLCKVKIGGIINDVSTLVMGNDVLIGMELLSNYQICVDGGKGVVNVMEDKVGVPFAETNRGPVSDQTGSRFDRLSNELRKLTGGY